MLPAGRAAEGVFASTLTPRRRGVEEIDLSALWELIDFLSAKRINGIVLLGITGEFVHFTMDERVRMMSLAVRRSRVPVLINVSHSTLDCALQLGEAGLRAGAAGLLLSPPAFCRYDQKDLVAFYSIFHEQLGKRVPIYVSNSPACASAVEPDTAADLLALGYAGVHDASGDWSTFEAMNRRSAGKSVLIGADGLFARARAAGAAGAISAAGCAIPELLLGLDRAIGGGDTAAAAGLAARLDEFVSRSEPFPASAALREALAVRGLKTGQPPAPLALESTRGLAEFRNWFKSWLPQIEKAAQA